MPTIDTWTKPYPRAVWEAFLADLEDEARDYEAATLAALRQDQIGSPDATKSAPHQYSSTQVNLPADVAAQVYDLARAIPDADLAGDGRTTQDAHVTVKYGLTTSDPEDVRDALDGEGPITATLGPATIFDAPDYDVLKLDVDSPDLHRLHAALNALPHGDTHAQYQPHVTICYLQKGRGQQYTGPTPLNNRTVQFDTVHFSGKDRVVTPIALEGVNAARYYTGLLVFDESETRDEHGEWTSSGGSSESSPPPVSPLVTDEENAGGDDDPDDGSDGTRAAGWVLVDGVAVLRSGGHGDGLTPPPPGGTDWSARDEQDIVTLGESTNQPSTTASNVDLNAEDERPTITPEQARYRDAAPDPTYRCAACAFFTEPDDCVRVKGTISPKGTCTLWELAPGRPRLTQDQPQSSTVAPADAGPTRALWILVDGVAVFRAYDENESRDDKGKWTGGGGGSGSAAKPTASPAPATAYTPAEAIIAKKYGVTKGLVDIGGFVGPSGTVFNVPDNKIHGDVARFTLGKLGIPLVPGAATENETVSKQLMATQNFVRLRTFRQPSGISAVVQVAAPVSRAQFNLIQRVNDLLAPNYSNVFEVIPPTTAPDQKSAFVYSFQDFEKLLRAAHYHPDQADSDEADPDAAPTSDRGSSTPEGDEGQSSHGDNPDVAPPTEAARVRDKLRQASETYTRAAVKLVEEREELDAQFQTWNDLANPDQATGDALWTKVHQFQRRRDKLEAQEPAVGRALVEVADPPKWLAFREDDGQFVRPTPAPVRAVADAGMDAFTKLVSKRTIRRNDGPMIRALVPATGAAASTSASATRSHFNIAWNMVNLAPGSGTNVVVHELGHWLESQDPNIHQAALAFLSRRTAGETPQPLARLQPTYGYAPDEMAKPDKFKQPYVGKIYPDNAATEIVSMGVEQMYTNPARFAREDPDYFDWTYTLLRGT